MITEAQLLKIAPHCDAERLAPILDQIGAKYRIDTPLRFTHWLAQMDEETGGFTAFVENLNYSAAALQRVWPKHFGLASAATYAGHPEAIANRAYANRMGNGDEASGDGWKYRGRGTLQITGLAEYLEAEHETGLPLVANPDQLSGVGSPGVETAAAFWTLHRCNALADANDIVGITKVVNGGLTNLATRQAAYANVHTVLSESPWVGPVLEVKPVSAEPISTVAPKPATPPAAPAVGALNVGSIARMAMGALAMWLFTHKVIASSGQEADFVNTMAPIVTAVAGLTWAAIKNNRQVIKFFGALYASPT